MTSKALLVVAFVALAGCADWERGPAPVVPEAGTTSDAGAAETATDGGALSFETDVLPVLERCKRCHVAGQEAGDTQLVFTGSASADYAAVSKFVDTSSPAGSRMLAKLSGKGHEGGSIYAPDSPEYQTILQWIQQGARP